MKNEFTLRDAEKKLLKTSKARNAVEREFRRLMVAHQIEELRKKNNMTQKELARRLHTTQQAVSRLEKESYTPSLTTLERVAEVFGKRLELKFI